MTNFKNYLAELLGTFILVFAGTAAIVVNDISGGMITHVGISLVFGLTVAAIIYAIGDISGAHINPAVTLGFWYAGRFPGKDVVFYIVSQFAGAILASVMVWILFHEHPTLGATIPAGSSAQSFLLEIILSFILMLIILNVSTGASEKGISAGIAIGSVVAVEALFAGPISGASMNPARSLGPALVNGHMDILWIYLLAPLIGVCTAVISCRCIHDEGACCRIRQSCPE